MPTHVKQIFTYAIYEGDKMNLNIKANGKANLMELRDLIPVEMWDFVYFLTEKSTYIKVETWIDHDMYKVTNY